MTALAPEVGIDLSRPRVPFGRLVAVEMRKLADTRAGKWLLGVTAAISVVVMVIMLWVLLANDLSTGFHTFLTAMSVPMSILLPVLGVLSITSEWSQRTALVTFTLEPHRGRVMAAKIAVGFLVSLAAVVIAAIAGAFGNVLLGLASGDDMVWDVNALELLGFYAMQVLGLLMGLAFGALLLSSPAAIVLFFAAVFVLPGVLGTVGAFVDWVADLSPWIDFSTAQAPLFDGGWTGEKWAQLFVSGTIWLIAPLVVGARRVLRSEIK